MDKEQARRKRWNESEKGKAARMKYDEKAYDRLHISVKKGLKSIYMEELSKDGTTLNGYINQILLEYLATKGYTDSDLEQIYEEAKEKGLQ